ncbi:MAG: 30S ribosomal protein S2 [Patescibacteria group bacterium]|jgi:small subunit ribosomal protein S2
MREVTLLEMLQKGVHFGHQESRWNPKMDQYIFTSRNGIHIINLESTLAKLQAAAVFAQTVGKGGGNVLFVGTKRQAKDIVRRAAEDCGMPFAVERWIGGTLTNFSTIHELIKKLRRLKSEKSVGLFEKYTKKERLSFQDEIEKLQRDIGGMEYMDTLPAALFVVDAAKERTAVREARKMNIPIIAMCDTNANPDAVQYAIPANDDATKSIDLVATVLAEAIAEGKKLMPATAPAAAPAVPATPTV